MREPEQFPDTPGFLEQYGPEAVDPLCILGEDIVENLTDAQQAFLLARMVVSTDRAAAKRAGVNYQTIFKWKSEHTAFKEAYDIIRRDPVNFALTVSKNILAKAALEHMALLNHPNIRVRQWAIDLAYRNQGLGEDKGGSKGGNTTNYFIGSAFEQVKRLAEVTPVREVTDEHAALPEPVDADYTVVGDGALAEAGRVDSVQQES